MGFVVLLLVFALVGFFVGVAKGWSDAEFDADLDPEFMYDEALSRKGGGSIFSSKSYESDFDRLMKPGSNEAAWFNAADDAGYDPENW